MRICELAATGTYLLNSGGTHSWCTLRPRCFLSTTAAEIAAEAAGHPGDGLAVAQRHLQHSARGVPAVMVAEAGTDVTQLVHPLAARLPTHHQAVVYLHGEALVGLVPQRPPLQLTHAAGAPASAAWEMSQPGKLFRPWPDPNKPEDHKADASIEPIPGSQRRDQPLAGKIEIQATWSTELPNVPASQTVLTAGAQIPRQPAAGAQGHEWNPAAERFVPALVVSAPPAVCDKGAGSGRV